MKAIPLQDMSRETWERKYRLRTKEGEILEHTIEDTFDRVANALASVESSSLNREIWARSFKQALLSGAICGGRIMSNAGAEAHKPAASTINCTVSGTLQDSMHGILQGVYEAGITLAAGCGIGYDFTTLRPKGAYVAGVGATTSGVVSFMGIYDAMCFTVASAGGRRGAQMGTMDVRHPDIEEFITAKREDGRLRQFNLSVLITDKFMSAVKEDKDWKLIFPLNPKEHRTVDTVWASWPTEGNYIVKEGKVLCRVYKTVKARDLWHKIMHSNYDFAEPGFILIDRYNQMNNNWFCEEIRATNPCGEQGLPPYGSCLLGSINLTMFVRNAFTRHATFDFESFCNTVRIFTRMLDNVVELNALPLEQQRSEIQMKRRHGMGYFGLGSAMAMLGYRYGDKSSIDFTDEVTRKLALVGLDTGVELAIEKGEAPILTEQFTVTEAMLNRNPIARDYYNVGSSISGRELLLKSGYMMMIAKEAPALYKRIEQHGLRFTHHSSIAPTGTMSLSFGNNVSNGIEPSFSHEYVRNVIVEGKNAKQDQTVFSYEMLVWKERDDWKQQLLPLSMVTAADVTPADHIAVQAAAQKWIDSSISKTINVPTDIPFEHFEACYENAYDAGCKGVSTFRFNPAAFQGVLVNKADLEATEYQFTLEDGSVVKATGNTQIMYAGQQQSAANLFDAHKEKTFGRY